MRKPVYVILTILFLVLFIELLSLWGLHRMFKRPIIWNADALYLRYGLNQQDFLNAKSIVFGGSTVSDDTVSFRYEGNVLTTTYCDPCKALPKPCRNLAEPALTIVDSWNLYDCLSKNETLHYVFFLNGINDARSNNIPAEQFSRDYRHIQFYDEAFILFGHTELVYIKAPTLVHLLANRLLNKDYLPKQNLQNLPSSEKEYLLPHGKEVKSVETFSVYLQLVINRAEEMGHKAIIGTFPFYHPDNYNLGLFLSGELDYSESIFMTEMYGQPDNVVKAINVHNSLLRSYKNLENENLIILELDSTIPKEGHYFNDICHLSPAGCDVLNRELSEVLSEKLKRTN